MAILEVTLLATYFNQEIVNRWNYVTGGTPAAVSLSYAMAFAFGAIYDGALPAPGYPTNTVMSNIRRNIVSGVVFQQLTVINPYDPVDFYQAPFVQPYGGNVPGEGMSPLVAFGFRTNQVRRDVRRATKRFAGVPEASVGAGGVIGSTILGELNDLAEVMSDILEYDDEGNTITFAPAVVSKEEYDPNPSVPTANHRAYRYYPTLAEQLEHTATGITWQTYDTVRSQVSRQYGKGK